MKSPCKLTDKTTMKTYILLGMFVFFTSSSAFSQSQEPYLNAAKRTADWLMGFAGEETNCDGLSWPVSNLNSGRYASMSLGSAGIGTFFLKLYNVTGDQVYLDIAEKAGNYSYYRQKYVYMGGPDTFTGAASGGNFMLQLYQTTGKTEFLTRARDYAQWLDQNKSVDDAGIYWRISPTYEKIFTGLAHGAAGVGMFLVDLYSATGESEYLAWAESTYQWMRQYIVNFRENGGGIGWKRLTTDTHAYHLWCGGSTGIIFFIRQLLDTTGKECYRTDLELTARGLMDHARDIHPGKAWQYTSAQAGSYPLVYCHGTSSTVHALYVAHENLKQSAILQAAQAGAEFLMSRKKEALTNQYYWNYFVSNNWIETGLFTGVASIGWSFCHFLDYDNDPRYMDMAIGAADWLLSIADVLPDGRTRFINFTSEEASEAKKAYNLGWYNGAAGIGIFLLDLVEKLKNTAVDTPNLIIHDQTEVFCNPNPFNGQSQITFNMNSPVRVKVEIYNIWGKRVRKLVRNRLFLPGKHSISWDATDDNGHAIATGVYLARVSTPQFSKSVKLIYQK